MRNYSKRRDFKQLLMDGNSGEAERVSRRYLETTYIIKETLSELILRNIFGGMPTDFEMLG